MQIQAPSPSDIKTGYDAIVWVAFTFLGFSVLLNGLFLRGAASKLSSALDRLADHETRLTVVENSSAVQREEIRRFWDLQVEKGHGRRESDS